MIRVILLYLSLPAWYCTVLSLETLDGTTGTITICNLKNDAPAGIDDHTEETRTFDKDIILL